MKSPAPGTHEIIRLRLVIAYDGRPFKGWQSQAGGGAVQDHVEHAFARVLGGAMVRVHGAGRTDAGVHALGQVAHASVPPKLPLPAWRPALNAYLPDEIRILRVTRMAQSFHAQYDARGKIYRYRVWNDTFLHPLEIGRAWFVPGKLELARLRHFAAILQGEHDFAGFAANRGEPPLETVRNVSRIEITQRGPKIEFLYQGNGFLYKMVRLLTGSIIRCASGKADEAWLELLLTEHGRRKTHFMAPSDGLYLVRVLY
jgi:tRNA pseudouridine38-40 synthase